MAVTSGFFNSIEGDRKYNSLQMAELFDGLINDGVYSTIYKQFRVQPNDGLTVQVDTGRAWFQHTWIKNDGLYLISLPPAEVLYDRIDAIVIEVNHNEAVRSDFITYVQGTPSSTPARPTLTKDPKGISQYPLAYVTVRRGMERITTSDITNMVGSSECPFVTGVVSVMNIDWLIEQWQSQWSDKIRVYESDWKNWYDNHTSQYNYQFYDWFSQLQALLDGDVATNMANEIFNLRTKLKLLVTERMYIDTIDDINSDPIRDSNGIPIDGVTMFECGCKK